MDDPIELPLSLELQVATLLLIGASILIWGYVFQRTCRRLPVLPYEPRRRVPWRGLDVLLAFLILELPVRFGIMLGVFGRDRVSEGPATEPGEQVDVQHAIVDLLRADPSPVTWLVCALVAVVVAPIVEEFAYRLLLQGWLEAEERRLRRRIRAPWRWFPGVAPVALVSLLFAMRHFRTAGPPLKPELLLQLMIYQGVWSLLTFGLVLWLVRARSGATALDLGFAREKLADDVRLGLVACAAVVAPVIAIQMTAQSVMPESVAADPVPLFFLALVLGALYYRTHRIVPAIVAHMAFNATNLLLLWLLVRAEPGADAMAGLW